HHFPRDSTRSTTRPTIGVSSFTRAIFAKAVSNPTTRRPASAFSSARAARKIVSPSGTPHLLLYQTPSAKTLPCYAGDHFQHLQLTGPAPRSLAMNRTLLVAAGTLASALFACILLQSEHQTRVF